MKLLEVIEKVASKIAPGRAPTFNEAQVLKALDIIAGQEPVGRTRLSKTLEIGVGATRTLLKHLKRENLVEGSKYGISLSKRGRRLYSDFKSTIGEGIEIPNSPLTVGPSNIAILVRNAAHGISRGVEQRDTAIKAGALGATTLIFSQNELTMPLSEKEVFEDISSIYRILTSKLSPRENDVIIIGSGENKVIAEIGAKMAVLELLRSKIES